MFSLPRFNLMSDGEKTKLNQEEARQQRFARRWLIMVVTPVFLGIISYRFFDDKGLPKAVGQERITAVLNSEPSVVGTIHAPRWPEILTEIRCQSSRTNPIGIVRTKKFWFRIKPDPIFEKTLKEKGFVAVPGRSPWLRLLKSIVPTAAILFSVWLAFKLSLGSRTRKDGN